MPKPPIVRLWLAVFSGYCALGVTLQSLPSLVVQRFHGGPLAVGTAVGIAFLATACGRPFAGRYGDAGHARPVVIAGGVAVALGGLGHLLAANLPLLLVARVLMGAGEAALFSGALPWVLAGIPAERRGRTAGWFGLSMWGGLALGPVLAVGMAYSLGPGTVWWGVLALGILAAALASAVSGQPRSMGHREGERLNWRGLIPRGAASPGLVLGLAAYGYGTVGALLVLHLRQDSVGGDGAALAVFAACFLLARSLGSPLVDRFGGRPVAIIAVLVQAVGLGLAGSTPQPFALIGTAVAGAGLSLIYPSAVAMTLCRAGALRPGASVGVMTSFWDLGVMTAGPLGGAVAASASYPAAFWTAAAVGGFAVLVLARFTSTRPQPESIPATIGRNHSQPPVTG